MTLVESHFKEVKEWARNLRVEVIREEFPIFCRNEWPTLNVGWTAEGTTHRVWGIIFGKPRHPDQAPMGWLPADFADPLYHGGEGENLDGSSEIGSGTDRNATTNQATIDEGLPLTRPAWDFNTAQGKKRLCIYCQALVGRPPAAATQPTSLAKISNPQQEKGEPPPAFLARAMEALHRCTPMDPEKPDTKSPVIPTFETQAVPDMR